MLRTLMLCSALLLLIAACQPAPPSGESKGGAAQQQKAPAAAAASAKADVAPPMAVGRHAQEGKTAYAFAPGMSLTQVKFIIDQAVADGHMTIAEETHETRSSYAVQNMPVHIFVLDIQREQPEKSLGLTLFNDQLVGVRVIYREINSTRAIKPAEKYGRPLHSKEWIGWWLKDEHMIIQNANDGSAHEVLDLTVARRHMPDIDRKALEAWLVRYEEPPPWMAEIVEKQKQQEATQPGTPGP